MRKSAKLLGDMRQVARAHGWGTSPTSQSVLLPDGRRRLTLSIFPRSPTASRKKPDLEKAAKKIGAKLIPTKVPVRGAFMVLYLEEKDNKEV